MKPVPFLRIAAAAGLAAVLAGSAHAAPPPTLVTLSNGLRVVLAPDSSAAGADVAVWYPAGVRDESPATAGIRHLLSRLGPRAGATAPEEPYRRQVVADGGEVRSSLTADYVTEWVSAPAEDVGPALRYAAGRFARNKVDAAQLEQARALTLADIRARASASPVSRAVLRLNASVFADDPYGRPVEGDAGAIARLTPAAVDAWRAQHLGANGALLTVVGRFDPEGTLALVRALFGALPRGASAPAPAAPRPRTGPSSTAETFDTPVNLLVVGWRVPGQEDPDAAAIDLLVDLLGPGDAGRLGDEMRRRLAAPLLVQVGIDHHASNSMLWAFAGLSGDTTAAETALIDVVDGLVQAPVEGSALDRARAPLMTQRLFQLQSPRARAQAIGETVLAGGDPARIAARIEALASLTPADLQRVAKRIFTPEARASVLLLPSGGAR